LVHERRGVTSDDEPPGDAEGGTEPGETLASGEGRVRRRESRCGGTFLGRLFGRIEERAACSFPRREEWLA
jgi:hypothetical protein